MSQKWSQGAAEARSPLCQHKQVPELWHWDQWATSQNGSYDISQNGDLIIKNRKSWCLDSTKNLYKHCWAINKYGCFSSLSIMLNFYQWIHIITWAYEFCNTYLKQIVYIFVLRQVVYICLGQCTSEGQSWFFMANFYFQAKVPQSHRVHY